MFRTFYKDVRLTEALSRLLLSPKFIGAALLLLGWFLYVARDYSPNWRVERRRKRILSKKDSANPKVIKTSKNHFLLLPFVPLAFIYLLIRLIRGLFRIGVYCLVDGFLWMLAKIPSLISWYMRYLSQLPEVIKIASPRYWERYVISPSATVLDYSLEVFFRRVSGESNIVPYLTVSSFRGKITNIWCTLCTVWESFRLFLLATYDSLVRPFWRTSQTIFFHIPSWIASRASYMGKRTLQHLQVPALDLIYDLRELFRYVWRMAGVAQIAIKPVITNTLYSLKTLSQHIYDRYFNKFFNTVPTWKILVQNHLLPTSLRIAQFYQYVITTSWRYSTMLTGDMCKLLSHSFKATVLWIWSVGVPQSRRFVTNTFVLSHEFICTVLSQTYRSLKYFYDNVSYTSIGRIRSYVGTALLQLYLVLHDAFWNFVAFIQVKGFEFWIVIRDSIVHACKQFVPLAVQVYRKARVAIRSISLYTVRWGVALLSNVQSLIVSLKPLYSLIQVSYTCAISWGLQMVKKARLALKAMCQMIRTLLEKSWPVMVDCLAKTSSFLFQNCTLFTQLLQESYHEMRPVFVTWKESIVYAADEVIQHLGRVIIDSVKTFQSKWE